MLNVYKVMSTNISTAIAQHGEICAKQPLIKAMRVVKKESLNVISSWILSKSIDADLVNNFKFYCFENFIKLFYLGCRKFYTTFAGCGFTRLSKEYSRSERS